MNPPIVLLGAAWLAVAIALSAAGVLAALKPPAPQLLIIALTAALIISGARVRAFRAWLAAIPTRAVVALHVVRLVGFYFLFLYARGELPYDFAVLGGRGDIAVATLAFVLVVFVRSLESQRTLVLVWNTLGFADILFVVATAARLGRADPASMIALTHLPLSLLPTFLVPLIIASHVLIFVRLRRGAAA
jgi:hypothetical protein